MAEANSFACWSIITRLDLGPYSALTASPPIDISMLLHSNSGHIQGQQEDVLAPAAFQWQWPMGSPIKLKFVETALAHWTVGLMP
eukprot:242156-Amphidinium_carterae.1